MWHPDSIYDASGHLDEGVVHAWLDGELAAADAGAVESHAAACGMCAARVAEARGLVAGAQRVLRALDGQASVVPVAVRTSRRWTTRRVSLAAAAVLMFAAGSLVIRDQGARGVTTREAAEHAVAGPVVASPSLEAAPPMAPPLSAPPSSARIGQREGSRIDASEPPVPAAAPAPPAPRTAAPPPPPPAPGMPAAVAQASPAPTGNVLAGRIAGVDTRSTAAPDRIMARGARTAPAPAAGAMSGVASDAAAVSGRDARSDTAVRRRIPERAIALEAVTLSTPTADVALVEKSSRAAGTALEDAKLIGCWRIAGSDSLLVLDTLPRASSYVGPQRRREPIRWRRVDSVHVLRIEPIAPATADSGERVVRRGTLVRAACP